LASNDLSTRIRLDVERGRPRDEIVAGLVQGGLSQASAERFVDRAIAAHEAGPPPPATAPAAADTDAEEDKGGRTSLVSGAFWLSLGTCVTGITYLLAKPGGKYMLAYGAVIGGLVAFGRGLMRFWSVRPEPPFPWKAVAIAGLVPVMGMAGIVGYVKVRDASRRAAAQRAADAVQEARESEARASGDQARLAVEQDRAEAAFTQAKATEQYLTQQHADRVTMFLKLLRNPQSSRACEAALELGRLGARDAIPDLQGRLADATSPNVQGCAATALVGLGEVDGPLAFYVASSQSSNDDLKRIAITGFGTIGPRAAPAALPFLTAEVQSPDSTHRYLAVDALSKMGPEGVPLVRGALNDSDPSVKNKATAALAEMGER
jgi:HEAT repeat protein